MPTVSFSHTCRRGYLSQRAEAKTALDVTGLMADVTDWVIGGSSEDQDVILSIFVYIEIFCYKLLVASLDFNG